MKKLHPAAAATALAFALGAVLSRSGYTSYDPVDTAIFIVFLVFFWWLISDFSGGKAVANDGQDKDNGLAFRFGRFLGRIFGRCSHTID
jgi:hypothetical protein